MQSAQEVSTSNRNLDLDSKTVEKAFNTYWTPSKIQHFYRVKEFFNSLHKLQPPYCPRQAMRQYIASHFPIPTTFDAFWKYYIKTLKYRKPDNLKIILKQLKKDEKSNPNPFIDRFNRLSEQIKNHHCSIECGFHEISYHLIHKHNNIEDGYVFDLRYDKNIDDVRQLLLSIKVEGVTVECLREGENNKIKSSNENNDFCGEDRFWEEYDLSKATGRAARFKEDLWYEIREFYLKHDNPTTDPLYGKRKEILRNLSPYYRVVNLNDRQGWVPYHIDELPNSSMGRPVSLDTLHRYIQALEKVK